MTGDTALQELDTALLGHSDAWYRRTDPFGLVAFILGSIPGFFVVGNFGFADDYGQMSLTQQQILGWAKSMVGCGRPVQLVALAIWKCFPSISDLWGYHVVAALVGGLCAWTLYAFIRSLGRSAASSLFIGLGSLCLVPGFLIQIAWLQMFPFLLASVASITGARWLIEAKHRPWISGLLFALAWLCYQPSALIGIILIAATPFLAMSDVAMNSWRQLWWRRLVQASIPLAVAGIASVIMVKIAVAAHWAKAGGRHQFLGNVSGHIHAWLHNQLPMTFRLWSPFGLSHRVLVIELIFGLITVGVALRRRRVLESVIAVLFMGAGSYLLAFATAAFDADARALVASQVAVALMELTGMALTVEWALARWRSLSVALLVAMSVLLSVHASMLLRNDYARPNKVELHLISQALNSKKCRNLDYIVLAHSPTSALGPAEANEFGSPTTKAPWMSQKLVQLVCAAAGVPHLALPHVVNRVTQPARTLDFNTLLNP